MVEGHTAHIRTFLFTVNPQNDDPEIADIQDQSMDEVDDETPVGLDVQVSATDIDSDSELNVNPFLLNELEFTCEGNQVTCVVTASSITGEATLTVTPDDDYNKTTIITVTVSDGELNDSTTFTLTINQINDAPVFGSIVCEEIIEGNNAGSLTCPGGTTITSIDFDSFGTPDGTCGNYTVSSCDCSPNDTGDWIGQSSISSISSSNSLCDGGDPCNGTLKRRYIQVTCGFDSSDMAIDEDTVLLHTLSAGDIDSDINLNELPFDLTNLVYSVELDNDDNGIASIEQETDELTITPTLDFNGIIIVTITVSDGELEDTATFNLIVAPDGDVPVLSPIDDQTMDEDGVLDVQLSAIDVDGDPIFFNIYIDDVFVFAVDQNLVYSEFSVDDNTDILTITPLADFNGDLTIRVEAYDANSAEDFIIDGTDEESFILTVNQVNDAPTTTEVTFHFATTINGSTYAYLEDGITVVDGVDESNAENTLDFNLDTSPFDIDVEPSLNLLPFDLSNLTYHVSEQIISGFDLDDNTFLDDQLGTITFEGSLAKWTPYPDFNGIEFFDFYVNDGEFDSNTSETRVWIQPVNDNVTPFNIIDSIHSDPDNDAIIFNDDPNFCIKLPNYEVDDAPLLINDIDSSNVMDNYVYLENNPYQIGNVTFKWERSSDIDTEQSINAYNEFLQYRLEFVDEVNELVYVIKNEIYDQAPDDQTECDVGDNCSITLNITEGPYQTYGLNEYYGHYDDEHDEGNLVIDGTVKYKWRVSAQDYAFYNFCTNCCKTTS